MLGALVSASNGTSPELDDEGPTDNDDDEGEDEDEDEDENEGGGFTRGRALRMGWKRREGGCDGGGGQADGR